MKHTTEFDAFLRDRVNIDQTRLDKLATRVDSVYRALKDDPTLGPLVRDKIPQGSWPHRTIIRPRAGGEFDADFLLLLEYDDEWAESPKSYPNAVYKALEDNSTYAEMPHGRRTRCVYVTYSVERDIGCHLDIVPYVILPDGRHVIVDQKINDWEPTSPEGFTTWIKERDTISRGTFRKVVRLMKYYKVERGSFNGVPSVILTTLLGRQVTEIRTAVDPSYYSDVPTALVHIVRDMSDWLDSQYGFPTIANPGGDGTTFDKRWNEETFNNFRDRMSACAEKMEEALVETNRDASIKLWRELFGDGFAPSSGSSNSSSTASKIAAVAASTSSLHHRPGQGG